MADKEKRIKAVFQVDSTGFNSSLKNINSSLRNSQSELKLASEGIKFFGRSSEKLKSVQESLNKQVELQSKKVNIYKESIEKTSKKLEENVKARDKLKDSLEKANKKYDEAVKLYGKESEQAKKAKEDVNNLTEEYKKKEKAVETNTRSIQNYETNMNKANAEMVKAQGELKKVSGELDKSNNKWLKSSENLKKSSEKLKDIGGKVSGTGDKIMKMTAPITAGSVASLKFSADFSDGMAKVGTIADKTKVPITKLREGALGLSKDFGVSATEITESMYQTISASVPTEKAVKFVGIATKAAKAGFTEASVAVDGLSTVLNSYGIEADKADKIANQMLITQNKGKTSFGELASSVGKVTPIAASLGVTTEELFSSLASTTAQGLATSESVTALSAAMSNIIKPSEGAAKAADALGLEFNANAVKTKGWIGFLQDVKTKLEQSSPAYAKKLDEVNKLRHAIDGAGKSSKNYKDQLEKEKEKIKQLQEAKKSLTSKDKDRKKAIDTEIKSIQEHVKTMQKQSKTEKEGIGNVKEMKKALSGKEKELKILEKTSQGSLSAFAQMFGSVNGLNDVLMLTSENGMKIYNETMQEMKTNTHALDDAFNEMSNTPGEKFRKSLNAMKVASIKFGDALMPLMEKGTQVITKLADTLNGLSKEQIENYAKWGMIAVASGGALKVIGGGISTVGNITGGISKLTKWLGKFSTGAKVAEGATTVANTALAGTAGSASLASGGLATLSTVAMPAVGILAAVGGAIYTAHTNMEYLKSSSTKSAQDMGVFRTAIANCNGHIIHTNSELEKMNVKHKDWNSKVSKDTQTSLNQIANKIADYSMELQHAEKIDNLVDSEAGKRLTTKLDDIVNSAINKIKSRQPEMQKALVDGFNADGKLDENEKKILASLNKSGEEQIKKVQEIKNKILDLEKKASKQQGDAKRKTLEEVDQLTKKIGQIEMNNTVKSKEELIAAQAEFNARMNNLDMNGLSKLLVEKAKVRESETKKIKENYDKQIELLKLNMGNMDAETKKAAEKKIAELEQQKTKELDIENKKYSGYLDAAIEKYPQLINYINMQHGTMLSKEEQQKQLELNKYTSKMDGMLGITETGYYKIKDTTSGKMEECYVEVDKATGQIVGAWQKSTNTIYGNPVKVRESIQKGLKNGASFQPIKDSYDRKKQDIWRNAIEVQSETKYGIFDWVTDAYNSTQSWLHRHPFVASIAKQAGGFGGFGGFFGHNWTGTNYWQGGLTTLHERGEELYDLPQGTRVYNAERSEQMVMQTAESVARKVANSMLKGQQGNNGNSLNINMENVNMTDKNSIKALAQELAFYIKQNNLGTGGVY